MIRNPNCIDRLYLSQGDEDVIYLDTCKIPQHSIDGIRFLYKQFKRRRNGVILNDPFKFTRNTQICLFVKAVRPLLHRPILILCQEGSEQGWTQRFDTWTDSNLVKEVAIETANPYIQKMVIINTMVNLHLFCAREWSIIIVDGDHVTTPNPILKLPFKACFKIWNTEINMKDNLDRFEEVYKWLFPRETFQKHYFIPDMENAVDIIEKSILLDSFFEDIVLRRDGDSIISLENYLREVGRLSETTISPVDPRSYPLPSLTPGHTTVRQHVAELSTGSRTVGDTTITPANITDTSEDTVMTVGDTTITPTVAAPTVMTVGDTTITPTRVPHTSAPHTSAPHTSAPRNPSPVHVVTISRKNKDATGTKIKRSKTRIDSETASNQFQPPIAVLSKLIEESPQTVDDGTFHKNVDYSIENYKRKNSQDNGKEQSNTESSKDETKTDKQIEIIEIDKEPDAAAQAPSEKLLEMDTLVFGHDTLISPVSDTPGKGHDTASDKKETEPHTILTCKPVGERSTNNKLFTDKSTSPLSSRTSSRCSDDTERDKKNDRKKLKSKSKVRTDKPEVDIIKINLDELNREMRDLATIDKSEIPSKKQKTTDSSQTATDSDEIKNTFNEQNKQSSVSGTKVNTEKIANSLKRNNVDAKMKECEESVSKKFKHTLLDRLF